MDDDTTPDYGLTDPGRLRRVAEHYLVAPEDTARLNTTVALAAQALEFPIGMVNILDDEFQHTIGSYRYDGTRLPRSEGMCQFVVVGGGSPLAVDDLRVDARFRVLPGVRNGFARSYLGVPLASREATAMGTLCLLDDQVRQLSTADVDRLAEFGEIVSDQLDLIRHNAGTVSSRERSASIAQALTAREIVPWYQPVVDLGTGRRVGFEALARWRRPDGSIESPDAFVGAAEDSDLVVDLDRAVIDAAVHDLARWRRRAPALRMNVNLSTRHLELADGAAYLRHVVGQADVDPAAVGVEITETRGLTDLDQASATVRDLQRAGFRVILDDFGNGWSSLDWLLGLGADGVKIDRAVTASLGTRVGDAVCRAVVSMTAELGISTTIEGISDPEHLEAARAHGFQYGQGYLWSSPVPRTAVDASI